MRCSCMHIYERSNTTRIASFFCFFFSKNIKRMVFFVITEPHVTLKVCCHRFVRYTVFMDFFIKGNHRCVEKHSFEVWNIDRLEKNIYLYICTKIELINFKIVQPTNCTIAQMHWRGPHISLLCVCLHLTYVNANTNTHIC